MNNIAIRLEEIGKKYHIGKHQNDANYRTLRETIASTVTAPFRRVGKLLRGHATGAADLDEIIWALKDISFEVAYGEVVGIIGRNGAGKSTLLKILSRITEPTEGIAKIYGRIGSLLEVGTGFHPELTGRENIFLNGAILGMSRVDINKKFDGIVDFAEINKFIDTPVKYYSSGMYLRLAFAVAAYLEPEILLVDEVLAVGDARFQKKCINKMEEVGQEGRTVLFVSHNMPAITRLCDRTILIGDGHVIKDGPSHKVVGHYLSSGTDTMANREWSDPKKAPGGEIARLRGVRVKAENCQITDNVKISQPVSIEIEYEVLKSDYIILPYFEYFNEEGINIFRSNDTDPAWQGNRRRPAGHYINTAWIPGHFLAEGIVYVTAVLQTINPRIPQFHERYVVAFQVVDDLQVNSARGNWVGRMRGAVRPYLKWTTNFTPNFDEIPSLKENKPLK